LVYVGRTLKTLATQCNVAVVCTNFTVNVDENHPIQKPALGTAWLPIPNKRLMLQKLPKGDTHVYTCTLDSTTHTLDQTRGGPVWEFKISHKGVTSSS